MAPPFPSAEEPQQDSTDVQPLKQRHINPLAELQIIHQDLNQDEPELSGEFAKPKTGSADDAPAADDARANSSLDNIGNKESGSRKRVLTDVAGRHPKRATIEENLDSDKIHFRCLIEPVYCSRVLGHGGRRLRSMRDKAGESSDFEAWISRDGDFEYRVVHTVGTPETVAKFFGLMVRAIFDESEEPSDSQSQSYVLKALMPHPIMGRLIGTRMAHFKEIERESAARLSAEHAKLPNSEDRVVYIRGVADAVHIAAYHLGTAFLRDYPRRQLKQYEPGPGKLDLRGDSTTNHDHANGHHERTNSDRTSLRNRIERSTPEPAAPASLPAVPAASNNSSSHAPSAASKPLVLPAFRETSPPALATAYEVAKESRKPQLRQRVPLPGISGLNFEAMLDNISRVTSCEVGLENDIFEIDGRPEDNVLALYIVYRFLNTAKT